MARVPDDDLEQLKKNISIPELCRARGIALERHGQHDLIGRCPFHKDKKPSFVVTPGKNLFHCLGCAAAGSVIDLVMKLDQLNFRQAVDKLLTSHPRISRASGLQSQNENHKADLDPVRATQLLERVVQIYEKNFLEASEGRQYLEQRGITDAGLFTRHCIGYANGRLKEILPANGQVRDELTSLGIFLENGTERFNGCLVFPVHDVQGNIVTLYGRCTNDQPAAGDLKRHLFLPHRPTGLWNAGIIKTRAEIILVESILDGLSMHMAGHANVISIQGTNGFRDQDLKLLCEHGVQKVILLLDSDAAGKQASTRLKEQFTRSAVNGVSSFSCQIKSLPEGCDPNSFLMKYGAAQLAQFLRAGSEEVVQRVRTATRTSPGPAEARATPAGLVLTCGLRQYEIRGLERGPRKLKITIRIEHAGKLHVDTLDLYSARARKTLSQDLCRLFQEPAETIEADITKLLRHCEQLPDEASTDEGTDPKHETRLTSREEQAARALGQDPRLIEIILKDFKQCGLIGEEPNKLLCYLAMTSRKTEEPLSVLTLSSSGAGKTALQDTTLKFCPPEDLVKLTSLSGKALFYKEQLSLKHKVLALEEGSGAEEAGYAIRNLISAGELTVETAIKDPLTGKLGTMENRVEGPTPVFYTTTDPEIDPETKSRFFVTSIDESREQTRAILAFQRRRQTRAGQVARANIEAILSRHRNFQRLLKSAVVINPYAEQLTYGDDSLLGRRDQPKYLSLIKAVAFLRQMQREWKVKNSKGQKLEEYIEVDREDLRLANKLAHEILGHSLDELSRPGRDLLMHLDSLIEQRVSKARGADEAAAQGPHNPLTPSGLASRCSVSFSRRDIREFTGWTNARVHRYLKELVDLEYVLIDSGRNGAPYRYRLAYEGQGKDGSRFMLGLKHVDELLDPNTDKESN